MRRLIAIISLLLAVDTGVSRPNILLPVFQRPALPNVTTTDLISLWAFPASRGEVETPENLETREQMIGEIVQIIGSKPTDLSFIHCAIGVSEDHIVNKLLEWAQEQKEGDGDWIMPPSRSEVAHGGNSTTLTSEFWSKFHSAVQMPKNISGTFAVPEFSRKLLTISEEVREQLFNVRDRVSSSVQDVIQSASNATS